MPSLGFSLHLSALTASPSARAGTPSLRTPREAALPHTERCLFTSCCIPRAPQRQAGLRALDPGAGRGQLGTPTAALAPGCSAAGLKFGSSSVSLSGNGLQGLCVMRGVSGRSNVFWHNFISFMLLYHCFFWFSCHLCCKCKVQVGSRDVRWGRATPCSSRCMCWWWLTAINCSPRGYVLYLIGHSIICIENLEVHLVRAYCVWIVYTGACQIQTRQKILRNTLLWSLAPFRLSRLVSLAEMLFLIFSVSRWSRNSM